MNTPAPIHQWLAAPLPDGAADVLDRVARTEDVRAVAVMPDVHLAGDFCVGTVVATSTRLFPTAVGGDIGCGMLALPFDGIADALADPDRAARLLAALYVYTPARRHHRRTAPPLPQSLREASFSAPALTKLLLGDAALEFGTLGGGNHFLEFQRDDVGQLWLMLHTGSRNLGQAVYHHHLARAVKTETRLHALDAASPEGRAYLADVALARHFAAENRRALAHAAARAVESIFHLAPRLDELFDCDHNHVQQETHLDQSLFIHRKGATRAGPDEPGIIPGSMGSAETDGSFHTLGRGHPDSLCSSSHGAGRQLSRTQARQRITVSALRQRIRGIWYDRQIERDLIEEAPQAYKPIAEVMRAQSALTRTLRRLRPLLIYKAR